MKKSPIQPDQLNPIGEREALSFFEATPCDAMIILAFTGDLMHTETIQACAHDKLHAAKKLIEQALDELAEQERYML